MIIRWSQEAAEDLDGLTDWIAERNVRAAIDTVTSILDGTRRLSDFPVLGRPGRVDRTRELPITGTPFIVVYVVEEEFVAVVRVLHGAREWPPAPGW